MFPAAMQHAEPPICRFCGRMPAILFANIHRGPMAVDDLHPAYEVKAACILCVLAAIEAHFRPKESPPAPTRHEQEMKDLRDLVEQLQGEVRDAVARLRTAQAPPGP